MTLQPVATGKIKKVIDTISSIQILRCLQEIQAANIWSIENANWKLSDSFVNKVNAD